MSKTFQLFSAIETSDITGFYKALSAKILNERNERGDTPLMLALKLGEVKMAAELIERGAELSIPDQDGRSVFDIISLIAEDYQNMLGGYKQLIGMMGNRLKVQATDAGLKPEEIWAIKKNGQHKRSGNVIELATEKRRLH